MSQDNIVFPFLVLKTYLRRLWNKPCFLQNQRFFIKWYGFQIHFKIYPKNSTKSHEGTIGHIYHPHLRDEKEDHVLFKACIVQIRWLRLPDCGPFTMLQWKLLEGTQIWNFYSYFHTAIRCLHGFSAGIGAFICFYTWMQSVQDMDCFPPFASSIWELRCDKSCSGIWIST